MKKLITQTQQQINTEKIEITNNYNNIVIVVNNPQKNYIQDLKDYIKNELNDESRITLIINNLNN